jgi:hypothetical protein
LRKGEALDPPASASLSKRMAGTVDYDLKDPQLNDGDPHYVIEPSSGAILAKRYAH